MIRVKQLAPGDTFLRYNGEAYRLIEKRAGSRYLIERLDDGRQWLTSGALMVTRESI